MITFGSLFSGIGGFDVGFERAGMRCVWQVEIDEYCRRVLAKHWPDVRRWDDVRTFPPEPTDQWRCDVICGGFPCQDISNAGKRAGITGERSGLWTEFARIIGVVRPQYIVVENVAALLGRGMGVVLGDLAALGYDAEWHVISAASVGAPHIRERVWILAHTDRCEQGRRQQPKRKQNRRDSHIARDGSQGELADTGQQRLPIPKQETVFGTRRRCERRAITKCDWWAVEPDVGRVAHGVPSRVDRLRCLGNSLVPQIAELIGRAIIDRDQPSIINTGEPNP